MVSRLFVGIAALFTIGVVALIYQKKTIAATPLPTGGGVASTTAPPAQTVVSSPISTPSLLPPVVTPSSNLSVTFSSVYDNNAQWVNQSVFQSTFPDAFTSAVSGGVPPYTYEWQLLNEFGTPIVPTAYEIVGGGLSSPNVTIKFESDEIGTIVLTVTDSTGATATRGFAFQTTMPVT